MTRIRRAHVHIKVIDSGRVRRYVCSPDQAQAQCRIERECGHPAATPVSCFADCLGYIEDTPALPPGPTGAD